MPAITTFNDFMTATGPSYLKGADKVINEAVKNTYAFSRLLKNKTTEQTIQGGTEIRDVIMFDDARTFGFYQPNDTFTWSNPQVTDYVKAPWRFSIDHMSWTDHEVQLNTSEGNAAATKVMYKRLKRIKEQRMWTSMFNGFEESLWAPPSQAQMEADNGRLAYSLPFFITELASFSASLGRRGTFPFTAATNTGNTVMRLNPSLTAGEPRWTNQVELYNSASSALTPLGADWDDIYTPSLTAETVYSQGAASTHSVGNIFNAMDVMFMRLKYEAPASRQQYFENDALNRQMILTSRLGVQQYRNALRLSNDTLVSYQDPSYSSPQYAGIDVTYCSDLDSAAIYPANTGTAAAQSLAGYNSVVGSNGYSATATTGISSFGTETGANTIVRAPRYYFVNGNYLTPIFHSTRYFQTHDVMTHPNQPFTKVMPVDCWWNLFCNSRQRHGIVAPIVPV
jgi:hypothetical protein